MATLLVAASVCADNSKLSNETGQAAPVCEAAEAIQVFAAPDYVSEVWSADCLSGKYRNPVIHADYSDPDVVRVGNDYYMTSSSFTCIPGLPILHSKDLVNWSLIGHALRRHPEQRFSSPEHGNGVWAPSIRYHNGKFYIYWGDPDSGIYMVRADNPAGPWQEPVLVLDGLGMIDACPLWDDDGKAYIVHAWAASRCGIKSILTVREMNEEGTKADPRGRLVFDGTLNQPTIEGPKFYKRDGFYYILAPAGGVKAGWQLALRSKNVLGPYETKIVLEQGDTPVNGPHQGGWVQTPEGESWFMHFQDLGAYGRVVHLQPVEWIDDWPMMGRKDERGRQVPVLSFRKPVATGPEQVASPVESDEFDSGEPGLQWQWMANPEESWYELDTPGGCLRLNAEQLSAQDSRLWNAGNLLMQKFPAPSFTARTKLTLLAGSGVKSGLIIAGMDYSCVYLCRKGASFELVRLECERADKGGRETVTARQPFAGDTVYLEVSVEGPDAICRFRYSSDGQIYHPIGDSFKAREGKWIGAKVGIFCVKNEAEGTGSADFDWFRVEK
jgi:beta-xylosidase